MPHIGSLTTFTPATKILSAQVNSNFSTIVTAVNTYCLFTDVSTTVTATNTFSALQTFTAGVTLSGSSNLSVAGTSTLTGNTSVGGTLAVTGAATFSSTLASGNQTITGTLSVSSNATVSGTLGVTGVLTASGGVVGNLTGNVTGNVTGTSGSTTGNAATATALQTARAINGVNFDGTGAITVTAAAGTLSGATLNSGVTASSLTTLGTLAGNLIFGDNLYDIGASGATRPRTGYFGTSVVTPLLNNSGSTITLRGVTYTLPSADGTSGQVLQTNGSAVLTWAAASSGFVTGTGTTGTIAKWTGSSAVGNSSVFSESGTVGTITGTAVVTGATVTIGTTPATTGMIRIPKSSGIYARDSSNSLNTLLIGTDAADRITIGSSNTAALLLGAAQLAFPMVDGTANQVLQTNGSGSLSWTNAGGGGGISGLTTGKLPKAASSTSLTDSVISEATGAITIGGPLTVGSTYAFAVGGNSTLSGTLAVTGAATLSSTLAVTSNATIGGTCTITGLLTASGNCLVSGTFTVGGAATLNGNIQLGDSNGDVITPNGTFNSGLLAGSALDIGTSSQSWGTLWATLLKIGNNQVVGARDTGYSPTWNAVYAVNKTASLGPLATPGSFGQCAAAVDITALGGIVHAMYAAMLAHGLIGA